MLRSTRAPNWRVAQIPKPRLRRGRASCAARRTAAMMLTYPVQRQKIPREHRADAVVGKIKRWRSTETPRHVHDHSRRAESALQRMAFLERLLDGMKPAILAASASMVVTSAPCACATSVRQERRDLPSMSTVHTGTRRARSRREGRSAAAHGGGNRTAACAR